MVREIKGRRRRARRDAGAERTDARPRRERSSAPRKRDGASEARAARLGRRTSDIHARARRSTSAHGHREGGGRDGRVDSTRALASTEEHGEFDPAARPHYFSTYIYIIYIYNIYVYMLNI